MFTRFVVESEFVTCRTFFADLQSPPTQDLFWLLCSREEYYLYFSSSAGTVQEQRAQSTRRWKPDFPILVSLLIFSFQCLYTSVSHALLLSDSFERHASFSPLAKQRRGLIIFCFTWKSWWVFGGVIRGSGSRRKTGRFEKYCWGGCKKFVSLSKKMFSGNISETRLQIYFAYSCKNAVRFGKYSIWAIIVLK